jgi:hypothetical protein
MSTELNGKPEVISYDRLYKLWEQNNWSATAIDFTTDAEHWTTKLDEQQRRAALWNYAMFLVGEEAVARTLSPVLDAAPEHGQKIFLSTQIVDESRHHVFFDRFMREVAGQGADITSTLLSMEPHLTWGFREVFAELDRLTEALHDDASDRKLLTEVIALYHIIVEGVLAIPGQHFIQRYVEKYEILPGFTEGITNVSRDEARHVAFGVKFLGELVRSDPACRKAAIDLFERVLPMTAGVFVPPNRDRSYAECFGFTVTEIFAFGMRSLETKLARIGIDVTEIPILTRQDLSASFEERARRSWVLIDAGVLGDDTREPEMDREAMELVFDGVARALDLETLRSLHGPLEWNFTDFEPWHIVVTNGHAEAKPGRAGNAALTFETTAGEWAKIAVGRVDARRSLLKRKLKVHGNWSAKAKLAKLFD